MKETTRAPFDHGRLCIFLCLCGIVLINILPLPCFGIETGYAEPVFSVTSTNEPLHKVLAKISKATGYQIEITKSWENESITASLKNSTLEEGIKEVLRLIGNPSYIIVKNDSVKKVEIIITDASSGYSSAGTNSPAEHRQKKPWEELYPGAALKRHNEVTGVDAGAETDPIDEEMAPQEGKEEPPEFFIMLPD